MVLNTRSAAQLLAAEDQLCKSLRMGTPCALNSPDFQIRSSVLRALLLRLDHPAFAPGHLPVECNRWVISGAIFDERIDLGDGRLPGGCPLPSLEFVDCTFKGGLSANGAHIERLTLKNCAFLAAPNKPGPGTADKSGKDLPTPLSLRYLTLSTELRLLNLEPYDEESFLWIDATGLKATAIRMRDVKLRAPVGESVQDDGYARYAFDLASGDIAGDMTVMPNVSMQGGFRLRSARIGGDLWARGIRLTDGETGQTRPYVKRVRYALSAQAARIRGNFIIGSYGIGIGQTVHLSGGVWLLGIEVTGILEMTGIEVDQAFSIVLTYARLGSVRIDSFQLPSGSIRPQMHGGLQIESASIEGQLIIDGDLGQLSIAAAHVGGDLSVKGSVSALEAPRLGVEGDVRLTCTCGTDGGSADIVLRNASIRGQLDLSELDFAGQSAPRKLDARGMTVGRALIASRSLPIFSGARWTALSWAPYVLAIEALFSANPESADADDWTTAEGTYASAYVTFLSNRHTGRSMLVDGNQQRIFSIFDAADIRSEEAIKDYLRLYCACAWSEEGPISVLEGDQDLPPELQKKVEITPLEYELRTVEGTPPLEEAHITGHYRVGGRIYLGEFRVDEHGEVGIAVSTRRLVFDGSEFLKQSRRYSPPYRYGASLYTADYSPLNAGKPLSLAEFDQEIPNWRRMLVPDNRFSGTSIDLRDASCNTLRDAGGAAWTMATLRLENFTYKRVSSSPDEIKSRISWLRQRPNDEMFTPQPYAELARVLSEQGDEEASREVEREKMHEQLMLRIGRAKARRSTAWLGWRLWDFVYGEGFGYGLSLYRAARTVLLFWLLGALVVWQANVHNQITLNTATVSTELTNTQEGEIASTIPVVSGQAVPDLPCGRAINPFLYAIEIFTPLLNLHQEARCDIRETLPHQEVLSIPRLLEFAKFFYELLGYVVTSLAVLTFSGLARRWDQN